MEKHLNRAIFLYCAIMTLLLLLSTGVFLVFGLNIPNTYDVVVAFLVLIISSNILADIFYHG